MIKRLLPVCENVYRGSAPDIEDVVWLKQKLKINKIVSLDKASGDKIEKICKILDIIHIKCYIDFSNQSLANLLKHNLYLLLYKNGPTFVHCFEGKDRTGLVCALFEIKYLNSTPHKALDKAKDYGFGEQTSKEAIALFTKLILACKPEKPLEQDEKEFEKNNQKKDHNNAGDIVSNEREYSGDYRKDFIDEARTVSFAPQIAGSRQYPFDQVYNELQDQSPTRENYLDQKIINKHKDNKNNTALVGQYNNMAGIYGEGPTINDGGFIFD